MIRGNLVAAVVLALLGASVAWQARALPYWVDYAPGPGFLPYWLGVLLAVTSLAELIRGQSPRSARRKEVTVPSSRAALTRQTAALAALTTAAVALVPVVGIVIATGILTASASWLLDSKRTLSNAAATVTVPGVIWLVFAEWLGVPLPRGPLGF